MRAKTIILHPLLEISGIPNFKFYLVLSDALPEDNWVNKKILMILKETDLQGLYIRVIDEYLTHHEAPEDLEVYFVTP